MCRVLTKWEDYLKTKAPHWFIDVWLHKQHGKPTAASCCYIKAVRGDLTTDSSYPEALLHREKLHIWLVNTVKPISHCSWWMETVFLFSALLIWCIGGWFRAALKKRICIFNLMQRRWIDSYHMSRVIGAKHSGVTFSYFSLSPPSKDELHEHFFGSWAKTQAPSWQIEVGECICCQVNVYFAAQWLNAKLLSIVVICVAAARWSIQ